VGKAATNEALKLRATFWNNLAIGSALAGVLLPVYSFLKSGPDIITETEIARYVATTIMALVFSYMFRVWSNIIISRIVD
jgi:hypothetical protein